MSTSTRASFDRAVRLADGATLWTSSSVEPGAVAVVLLHGGPGLWDYLAPLADLLPAGLTTHRYDQRGCGRSSPDTDHRMARYVADLDELRANLGHENWVVLGHSFGAALALAYAAAHPARVRGLVLCNGVGLDWPSYSGRYSERAAARRTATEQDRLRELDTRDRTWPEEVEWRTLWWLPDVADPVAARQQVEEMARTPLLINRESNRAINAETRAVDLGTAERVCRSVDVPTLLLHGIEDPRPVDGVRLLADALPDSELVVLAGAGHLPWLDEPDAVAREIAQFLNRLPTPTSEL